MIKKTIYLSSAAYLHQKDLQIVVEFRSEEDDEKTHHYPIEDVGVLVIDHPAILLTQSLLGALIDNNTAVVTCNKKHMPSGLLLALDSNDIQSERYKYQLESSTPLKKQLWGQTVSAKIFNQANSLRLIGCKADNMIRWSRKVKSGDLNNLEARAAAYYWKNFFPYIEFVRNYEGNAPNQLLNYGYAILRAIVARSLAGSGLLVTQGIHHHNKYNAYCLADDIMEPFRPYVDNIVCEIVGNGEDFSELSHSIKKQLLEIATATIFINEESSPLMVGAQKTTSSLAKCYMGEQRKVIYPEMFYGI